jgi:hypothetical protein
MCGADPEAAAACVSSVRGARVEAEARTEAFPRDDGAHTHWTTSGDQPIACTLIRTPLIVVVDEETDFPLKHGGAEKNLCVQAFGLAATPWNDASTSPMLASPSGPSVTTSLPTSGCSPTSATSKRSSPSTSRESSQRPMACQPAMSSTGASALRPSPRASARSNPYIHWPTLMQRCFDIDVLLCPHCLGRRRIIAFLEDPVVVHQILSHCGLLETGSDPPLPVPAELF